MEKEGDDLVAMESKARELQAPETEEVPESQEKQPVTAVRDPRINLKEVGSLRKALENLRCDADDAGDARSSGLLLTDILNATLADGGARPKVRTATKPSASLPAFSELSGVPQTGDVRSSVSSHEHRNLADFRRTKFDGCSTMKPLLGDLAEEDTPAGDKGMSLENIAVSSSGTKDCLTGTDLRRELESNTVHPGERRASRDVEDQLIKITHSSKIVSEIKLTLDELKERVARALEKSTAKQRDAPVSTKSDESVTCNGENTGENQQPGFERTRRKKWYTPTGEDPSKDFPGWPPYKRKRSGPVWLRKYENLDSNSENKSVSDPLLEVSPESNPECESKIDSYCLEEPATDVPVVEESGIPDELVATDEHDSLHQDPSSKSGKSLWKKKKLTAPKDRSKRDDRKIVWAESIPVLSDGGVRKASEIIGELVENVTELYKDIELYSKEIGKTWPVTRPDIKEMKMTETDGVDGPNHDEQSTPPSKSRENADHLCLASAECKELRKLLDEFSKNCRTDCDPKENGMSSSSSRASDDDSTASERSNLEDVIADQTKGDVIATKGSISIPAKTLDPRTTAKSPICPSVDAHEVVPGKHVSDSGDFETGYVVIEDLITSKDSIERLEVSKSDDSFSEKKIAKRPESGKSTDGSTLEAGDVPPERDTGCEGQQRGRRSKRIEVSFAPCIYVTTDKGEQIDLLGEQFHNRDILCDAESQDSSLPDKKSSFSAGGRTTPPGKAIDDESPEHYEIIYLGRRKRSEAYIQPEIDEDKQFGAVAEERDCATTKGDSLELSEFGYQKIEHELNTSFQRATESARNLEPHIEKCVRQPEYASGCQGGSSGMDARDHSRAGSLDEDSLLRKDDSLDADEFDSMRVEPNSVPDISIEEMSGTIDLSLNTGSTSPCSRGVDRVSAAGEILLLSESSAADVRSTDHRQDPCGDSPDFAASCVSEEPEGLRDDISDDVRSCETDLISHSVSDTSRERN